MDKTKQIWYRYANDLNNLNTDCVDLLSKCYFMLGQKPDVDQIVMMSKFLVDDLANYYSRYTIDEVSFALEQGIRHSDNGGFINVRNWNIWLKEHKQKAIAARQRNSLEPYLRKKENDKLIANTINKAKRLK